MSEEIFTRTQLLIGKENLNKLLKSKVVVFGVGGVGSFVVESLVRSGIGNLVLIDDDVICTSNLNRQIHATKDTIGMVKVEAMKNRVLSINDKCNVEIHKTFVLKDNIEALIPEDTTYVVDAIDTVTAKIALIEYCKQKNIPIISSMGTGNKLDPTKLQIAYIEKTSVCPLAKVMRTELKKKGIKKVKVLYSEEIPLKPRSEEVNPPSDEANSSIKKRQSPGSISFVPPVAGMIIGGEVIKDIIGMN